MGPWAIGEKGNPDEDALRLWEAQGRCFLRAGCPDNPGFTVFLAVLCKNKQHFLTGAWHDSSKSNFFDIAVLEKLKLQPRIA